MSPEDFLQKALPLIRNKKKIERLGTLRFESCLLAETASGGRH